MIQRVKKWSKNYPHIPVAFATQKEQKGTGHAVLATKSLFQEISSAASVTILPGDVPRIESNTIRGIMDHFSQELPACCVLTTVVEDPTGYGRIVRTSDGNIKEIVEEKDATQQQKKISEINTGILTFQVGKLFHYIAHLECTNASKEYYLTDMVSILIKNKERVSILINKKHSQFLGVNSIQQLEYLQNIV